MRTLHRASSPLPALPELPEWPAPPEPSPKRPDAGHASVEAAARAARDEVFVVQGRSMPSGEAWWQAVATDPQAWAWVERIWREGRLSAEAFGGGIPPALQAVHEQLRPTRAHDEWLGRTCVARLVDRLAPPGPMAWAGHVLDPEGLRAWCTQLLALPGREAPEALRALQDWRQVWEGQFLRNRVEAALREREGPRGAWARATWPWLAWREQWEAAMAPARAQVWQDACRWLGADVPPPDPGRLGPPHALTMPEGSPEWVFLRWLSLQDDAQAMSALRMSLGERMNEEAGEVPPGLAQWDAMTLAWAEALWPLALSAVRGHLVAQSAALQQHWRRASVLASESSGLLGRWQGLVALRWPPRDLAERLADGMALWQQLAREVAQLDGEVKALLAERELPPPPSGWGPQAARWRQEAASPILRSAQAWCQAWQRMYAEVRAQSGATERLNWAERWRHRVLSAPGFLVLLAVWSLLSVTVGSGLGWLPVLLTIQQVAVLAPKWDAFRQWQRRLADLLPGWQQRVMLH